MDWSNERYIRLYVRDTTTWLRLGWDGQSVLMQVLRKMDMSGVLDIDDMEPWEVVVLHCAAPEDVAKRGMAACLKRGVLEHNGPYLVAPNFVDAQEASKSDRQRQREARERRRAHAVRQNVTGPHAASHDVTDSDQASRFVTDRHDVSQVDTPGHDVSLSSSSGAVQCPAVAGAVSPPGDGDVSDDGDQSPPVAPVPAQLTALPPSSGDHLRRGYRERLNRAGRFESPSRTNADAMNELAGWAHGALTAAQAETLLDRFFGCPKAEEANFAPAFLRQWAGEYLEGKPVGAKRESGTFKPRRTDPQPPAATSWSRNAMDNPDVRARAERLRAKQAAKTGGAAS